MVFIQAPGGVEIPDRLLVPDIPGLKHGRDERRAASGGVAIQSDAIEMDDERITAERAFDVKRPRKRISALRTADAILVHAAGIDGVGMDGIAGKDFEGGRDSAGEMAMELSRLEVMTGRRTGRPRGRAAGRTSEFQS